MDVMRQVMKGEGGVMGLYKGLLPTMVREVAGCSAMFAAYEAIKLAVVKQQVPPIAFLSHVRVQQMLTDREQERLGRHSYLYL